MTEEYRYNLELFKEIRRFLTYREQLGMFTVLANLLGNIMIFVPYGFFISMAGKSMGFFKYYFQYGAESGRGNNTTFYESRKF